MAHGLYRGVWGHAPPEKNWKMASLRLFLVGFGTGKLSQSLKRIFELTTSVHTTRLYTMQFSEDNLYITEYIGEYHSTWILSSKNVDFIEVKFHAIASEPIHTAYLDLW